MRRAALASAISVLIAVVALPPGVASASQGDAVAPVVAPPEPTGPSGGGQQPVPLSNEITLTTWTHPEIGGWIHTLPDVSSHRIAPIGLLTSDGFAEVYVLLDSYVDAHGEEWVRIRVPGRPNGRTGWVPRELLGSFHHTRWRIVVSLSQRRMYISRAAHLLEEFPVGVGKPSTPTPTGRFWIREVFKVSSPSSPYWPYALGTSDYSTLSEWAGGGVIGIHGPFGEPQRIPGDPSHGCIRMLPADVSWLAMHVTLGTPVDVES